MKNIAVFFGGKSVEHDISVITGLQAMNNLSGDYKIFPIYIKSDGEFVTGSNLKDPHIYLNFAKNVKNIMKISFNLGKSEIFLIKNNKIKKRIKIDCALLCNHGHGGEDGCLQGLLELCEIPYSSASVPASAIMMDKELTKKILISEHIDTPAYIQFSAHEYKTQTGDILQKIYNEISFPCIIKPARLGSSVGVNICSSDDVLEQAIDNAFLFDDKIVVEKFIQNAQEFCCAAVRCDNKTYLSKVTMVHTGDVYTFKEKYLDNFNHDSAIINKNLQDRIKKLTEKVYNIFDCDGVVRIDFLYSKSEDILYVNEPNSIPGSLAFNMFDGKFDDLLNLMINGAIKKYQKRKEIVYSFSSDAIENFIKTSSGKKLSKQGAI